jgi:hypothetical protein
MMLKNTKHTLRLTMHRLAAFSVVRSEKAGTHSMIHRLVHWFMKPPDEAPPFAAAILDRFRRGTIFLIEGILNFTRLKNSASDALSELVSLCRIFLRRLTAYLKSDAELCFCLASLRDRL